MGQPLRRMVCGWPQPYKILMVGLDAAGKTTLLYRIKEGRVVTTIPTDGFNVETLVHRNVNFTVWDIGFRDKLVPLWKHHCQGVSAVVFVVDGSDASRLPEAKEVLKVLLKNEELVGIPLLVISNKIDLPTALCVAQFTEGLELTLANRLWHIQHTSTFSSDGIYESMDWLVSVVTRRNHVPINTIGTGN